MKKLLAALLCLLLLSVGTALADELKPGDTFSVTVSISANPNDAYAASYKLEYDSSALTLTGNATGLFISIPNDVQPVGASKTHKFTVKDGAAPGTYNVTVSAVSALGADRTEVGGVAYSISNGSVTVAGEPTPAPTAELTAEPTAAPTAAPTAEPTAEPTAAPTAAPTAEPTAEPTAAPTAAPTAEPTAEPTAVHTPVPTPEPTATPEPEKKTEWRYGQTVSSMGIRYRDIKPGLTNKWYMFTPLDLSQDGVTQLDLVAANASKVGFVTVTVKDGKVTVAYSVFGGVEESGMGFALLPDLASVTDVEAIDFTQFAFDQEISIQDDLAGDTQVLLQVMGNVDYDFYDPRAVRFFSDSQVYHEFVDSLMPIME